jgi:ribose transport system substrate-binding protein
MALWTIPRRIGVGAALIAAAASLGACGSSSGGGSTQSDPGTGLASATTSGDGYLAEAQAAVKKAESENGTYVLPEGGPTAQKGKSVYVVACGLSAEACAQPAKSVQEAAKTLDWKVTIVDGKFSPAGYDAGIRQAIAAKADGIIVVAIDCSNAKGALQAAKAANIPVVGVYAYDCSDPMVGGQSLFSATIDSNGPPDKWALDNAKLRAQYAVAASDGKAKAISLDQPEFLVAKYWTKGFADEFKKCADCELVASVPFTASDLGSGNAPQKLATVLLQHPDADTLFVTSDALLQAVLPAIRRSTNKNLRIIANEGFSATQQLIREGTVEAAVGIYSPWMGWSGADAMNRVFAGDTDIPNEGLGYHLITKDNVPPAGQVWKPTLDYETAFKDIWTGKG